MEKRESDGPPPIEGPDLRPSAIAREVRRIEHRTSLEAGRLGEEPVVPPTPKSVPGAGPPKGEEDQSGLSAEQKLELIDTQLRELAAKTGMPLDKARILDIRARVVDVQGRHRIKSPPAEPDPEQTESLAIKFLEARGCIVRRDGRRIRP